MRITNRGEFSISERCTKSTGHFVSSLICDIVAVRGNTFKYIPPATILKIFRQIVNFWVQNVSVRSSAEIGKMSSVHVEAAAHV